MPEQQTETLQEATPPEGLADITSPDSFIPDPQPSPVLWILLLVCIAALLALLWPLLRPKKKADEADSKKHFVTAKKRIQDLESNINTLTIGEVATDLSLIVREYITKVASDPTLFETHEEFAHRHNSLERFPEKARELAKSFFDRLAISKYGPSSNDASLAHNLCKEASELLHGLDSTQKKNVS